MLKNFLVQTILNMRKQGGYVMLNMAGLIALLLVFALTPLLNQLIGKTLSVGLSGVNGLAFIVVLISENAVLL
ncbi:MAG: hypothetical protein WAW07_06005 [Bacteroidales bacterium]